MKRVAKPTNIKTMLMSRGDNTGKKRKKEVSPVTVWLCGPLELMCFPLFGRRVSP